MIESRCGIVCSECSYKEKMNCAGCVNIAKPFWAATAEENCPVKSCCEGKDLDNCGFCADFPCEMLNQFSYDKEQGDDGKRIRQCKIWASLD